MKSLKHLKDISGVKSGKKVSDRHKLYWLMAVVVTVILYWLCTRDGSNIKKPNAPPSINLHEIKAPPIATSPAAIIKPVVKAMHDNAEIMREHAPTKLYHAQGAAGVPANGGATLLDRSNLAAFANQHTNYSMLHAYKEPHADYSILSGELIHATLETAINSDLPGMVRAVVATPIYSYVGHRQLVPAGSRLVGQYSSQIQQGVNRVFILWQRIILPNAIIIPLDSPGTDALGRAGLGANVYSTHFMRRFAQAGLLSIIGAGVSNLGVSGGDQYNSAASYRMGIAQSLQQSAQSSVQAYNQQRPTIHIYQGTKVNVFVAHDLCFYAALHEDNTNV